MERSDDSSSAAQIAETAGGRSDEAPLLAGVDAPKVAGGYSYTRGVAILDLIFRFGAAAAALTATITMGNAEQTLPFFTQLLQFKASYENIPTFTYFVIALSIVTGYLILSLPFSLFSMAQAGPAFLLIVFDTVAMTFVTSAAASSAAIVYLAHNGNAAANWMTICLQFSDFCQKISGGVTAAFIAMALLVSILALSAISLRLHR